MQTSSAGRPCTHVGVCRSCFRDKKNEASRHTKRARTWVSLAAEGTFPLVDLKWLEKDKPALAPLPNTATGALGTLFLASEAWLASTLGGRGPARAGNRHWLPPLCSANNYQQSTAVGVSPGCWGESLVCSLGTVECSSPSAALARLGWDPGKCHGIPGSFISLSSNCTGPWARLLLDERTQETAASQAPASGLGPQCCEGQRECPSFLPQYVTSSSI